MPWNCLCSSKNKNRRPEISAPILNTEDTQKLQLIPLKRPLITSEHLHEKLVQPETEPLISLPIDVNKSKPNETDKTASSSRPSSLPPSAAITEVNAEVNCTDSGAIVKLDKKEIKRNKLLVQKQLKQQQKQQKKINKKTKKQQSNETNNNNNNNNNSKKNNNKKNDNGNNNNNKTNNQRQSNLKRPSTSSTAEVHTGSGKSKPLSNVKFVFDSNSNKENTENNDEIEIDNGIANSSVPTNETNIDNNGNYDVLPLIKIEPSSDDVCDGSVIETNNTNAAEQDSNNVINPPISRSSSGSIPFIDDSPHHRQHTPLLLELNTNVHDSRFITLQPQNVGAQTMIYARKIEKQNSAAIKLPPKRDQFDKSAQILYQSLKESIDHHFERAEQLNSKLCQVCHEFLLVPDAVKCLTCGLVCHHSCTVPEPKIRYTDTSYIIAQQWEKGREKTTFPNVYAYDYNQKKFENLAKVDRNGSIRITQPPTRSPPPPPLPSVPVPASPLSASASTPIEQSHVNDGSSSSSGERKYRKRKTKSLESRRNPQNALELSDSDAEEAAISVKPLTVNSDEVDSCTPLTEIVVSTTDEPAICLDSNTISNDATSFDKSQLSYDEILKIDESPDDEADVTEPIYNTTVEVHNEPTSIVLEIREENDIGEKSAVIRATSPPRESSIVAKMTKEKELEDVPENEMENDSDSLIQSTAATDENKNIIEITSDQPLGLVLQCDINKNIILTDAKSKLKIEIDHNHNDIELPVSVPVTSSNTNESTTTINDTNRTINNVQNRVTVKRNEFRRISDSSRSSFDESDGMESEPTYAKVDKTNILKNYDAKSLISKSQTFPVQSSQHHEKTTDHLGLNYVTERILASVLPHRTASQQQHRQLQLQQQQQLDNEYNNGGPHTTDALVDDLPQDIYEQELISMLEQKHGKNYKLFDLESCISTITLEKLCELCKHIDSWLGSGREKVVVLQDRGDRQRLGSAIAAYLDYLDICASSYTHRNGLSNEDVRAHNTIARNWLDLDKFSMKKFLEDVIGPLRVPSHRRYLQYFSGLLSGQIRINSLPLYLKFITIESPPSWLHYEPISLQQAEWRSFIKIYEGLNCVFTSDIHVIPITTRQFIYEIGQLRLRGDVIIRCYQITTNERAYSQQSNELQSTKRELMFSTQFHTCAITNRDVTFYRNDLDYACDDPRFPADHKVTLHFGDNNQSNDNRGLYFQSPLVKLEPLNAVTKYNSLETFDDGSLHTQGPLDGSLYATILKSPKSPLKSPVFPPAFISNFVNNNHLVQQNNSNLIITTPTKPQRTSSTQNLISPPPEFSNKKLVEIQACYTTVSPVLPQRKSESNSSTLTRELNKSTNRSYTSTPSYEEIRVPSRSSSREITHRHQSYQTTPRPSSSLSTSYHQQPDLPQRSSSVSRSTSYTPNPNCYQPSQQLRSIDNYHYSNTSVQNGGSTTRSTSYQDGRESVRSPLTLSMDSGISSSGIANRRIQGSSVSPSSFPSQASPQDRHQELDDILSDMLLTVQDIPDINKNNNNRQQFVRKSYNQTTSTIQNQRQPQQIQQYNTNTVKRSQSCASQEENSSVISRSTVNTTGHIKDRCGDFYDTASTTTTLTPTPSESGRETPIQQQHQQHYHHHHHQQQQQHAYNNNNSSAQREVVTQQTIQQRERELIMDLQNQSFDYPQQLRTTSSDRNNLQNSNTANVYSVTSEDEETIPYHAREDSRPFTYGDPTGVQLSPNSSGMIKAQSGLSSPSLVRKHLGQNVNNNNSSTTPRKNATNVRNDFEEMLLQRREKILNEKYSIGDKTPNGNSVNNNNSSSASANKWNTSSTSINNNSKSNGYHYHEPLKRSNTMDGGFGRGGGYTSDGSSGQTWLQLQQQKLRAKKELQHRGGDQDYYERTVHTDIRNRPLRSRSSQASHRYDGYSSDTAAFDSNAFIDEVDYRRPLHVQTPNRSGDRGGYHTITTTTTVSQKERPFVTVKRAHEQARGNNIIGSSPASPLAILNASPLGHIAQAQSQSQTNQNGLLSLADSNNVSPRNGHVRLGSDSSNNSPTLSSTSSSSGIATTPTTTNSTPETSPFGCDTFQNNRTKNSNQNSHQNNDKNNDNNNNNHHITFIDTNLPSYNCKKVAPNQQINTENSRTDNTMDDNNSGHLTLDRLLASLALENDLMDRHLSQINNNNILPIRYKQPLRTNELFSYETNGNSNYQRVTSDGTHANLNDVIANLTEFTRHESMREQNNYTNGNFATNGGSTIDYHNSNSNSNSNINNNSNNNNQHYHNSHLNHINHHNNNNHINNGINSNNNHINHRNYQEPCNNAIKRLTSESENSSSISPSLSERSNGIVSWSDQVREESFSSYRSETEPEISLGGSPRPETPAFPITPRTPYGLNGNISPALPPKSPTSIRRLNVNSLNNSTWSLRSAKSTAATYDWSKDLYTGTQIHNLNQVVNQNDTISCYASRRNSATSTANSEPQDIAPHLVKFVRDSSKYWYKPTISREEAVALLRNAAPGTFIVRDSTTFAKAFGLVVKVAYPPPGVQSKGPSSDELVRHFLVEPTTRGVRLKGCSNEPVFTSLSALVYQHSITPLALPCKLIIPERDLQNIEYHSPAQQQLISQGAACNVLYLFTCETESLTGPEAIRKSISLLYSRKPLPKPTEVHFKVSHQGITLTDNSRQLFFRKHYPASNISFCGLDPDDRRWSVRTSGDVPVSNKSIFAFVARRSTSSNDNQCHVFCELEPNQPATAITAFANKIIPSYGAQALSRNI